MKSILLLAALAMLIPPAQAYSRLTGEQFNRLAAMPPGAKDYLDLTTQQYMDVQRAHSYISAVHDMLEDREFCNTWTNPGEIDSDVVVAMRELPPERLNGNAALLIAEILQKRNPCPKRSHP